MSKTLAGKTAIVTGGSRGIGRAVCLKLAEEGANIALLYAGNAEKAAETAQEAAALGVKTLAIQCDVSDFDSSKAAVQQVTRELGAPEILVNNAGITRDALVLGMKEEQFDAVVDTNLKGAFHMIRHCCSSLMRRRGKIVNIASVAGLMGNAGQVNYSASKAGLIGMTKSVARELASRGVCCNAVAPGFIKTDMTAAIGQENPLLRQVPLGRMGQAEEVAALVAFLCSAAADYITGEVIRIDGGLAM